MARRIQALSAGWMGLEHLCCEQVVQYASVGLAYVLVCPRESQFVPFALV